MNFYKLDHYKCCLEQKQVRNWILEDTNNAIFELKGYIIMKDREMIDYWKKVVEYFRNFVRNIYNYNIDQIKRDYKFGDDAEQYASKLILIRLGERV